MGDGNDDNNQDQNDNNDDAGQQQQQTTPQFTQEDLNRVGARQKDEGRRSGERAVLEALGFSSLDEAKEFKRTLEEAEAAKLSEAERAKQEADRLRAEAQKARDDALLERKEATVERQLLEAGVPPKQASSVVRMVDFTKDSTDEEITAAVADLKERLPQLFNEPGRQPGLPGTDPGSGGDGRQRQPESATDRAKGRLAKRHPQTSK